MPRIAALGIALFAPMPRASRFGAITIEMP
jgi:hypothetical protein